MSLQIKKDMEKNIKGMVRYNEPMSRHTSFRIGGPAEVWVEPRDADDIRNCLRFSRDGDVPLFIIGGGSNMLVSDDGIKGIVMSMLSPFLKKISRDGRTVTASSSVTLGELLNFCSANGLAGMEFLAGIPGSAGGALMTNAGARHYGEAERWYSIGDFTEELEIMRGDGEIEILSKNQLAFGYRSLDIGDGIILGAKFLLGESSTEEIKGECRRFLDRKKRTQELNLPSAGCIFKNPQGLSKSAGELIEGCGLKGMKIGGAEISTKHANYIVNKGNANSGDVTRLIEAAKEKVKNRYGIELTSEIKIV